MSAVIVRRSTASSSNNQISFVWSGTPAQGDLLVAFIHVSLDGLAAVSQANTPSPGWQFAASGAVFGPSSTSNSRGTVYIFYRYAGPSEPLNTGNFSFTDDSTSVNIDGISGEVHQWRAQSPDGLVFITAGNGTPGTVPSGGTILGGQISIANNQDTTLLAVMAMENSVATNGNPGGGFIHIGGDTYHAGGGDSKHKTMWREVDIPGTYEAASTVDNGGNVGSVSAAFQDGATNRGKFIGLSIEDSGETGNQPHKFRSSLLWFSLEVDTGEEFGIHHKLRSSFAGLGVESAAVPDGIEWVSPPESGIALMPGPTYDLDWTDAIGFPAGEITYEVEFSDNLGASWTHLSSTLPGVTTTPFTTGSPMPLGEYLFRVRGFHASADFGGFGPWVVSPSLVIFVPDRSRFKFLDPVTGEEWANLAWDWFSPQYEGFHLAKPRVAKWGGLTPIRQVSPPQTRRQTLECFGVLIDNEAAKNVRDIFQGVDTTRDWFAARVEFTDIYGMIWGVTIDDFRLEYDTGLREWHWRTVLLVERAPSVYITGCEAQEIS